MRTEEEIRRRLDELLDATFDIEKHSTIAYLILKAQIEILEWILGKR